LEEIEAIARGAHGAGVPLQVDDVRMLVAVTNLDLYRREERLMELLSASERAELAGALQEGPAPRACTTFALWGNRTTEGKMYALRNLDWISQTGMHRMRLI